MVGTVDPQSVKLYTLERVELGHPIETGEMVSIAVVEASNIVRDVIEYLRNIFGGRMRKYETLFERVLERGEAAFKKALAERGYHGAFGVRYAHPNVVAGGAELIVYGTGFRRVDVSGAASSAEI